MTPGEDPRWMRRALHLAARGRGRTSPNPMVGAVLVNRNRRLGEGYHAQVGEPHAEVNALRAAGPAARGATLYVTLEPCCHHGRTPPCTDAIIHAGVAHVIAASADPDPRVSGKGIRRLRRAGISVSVGLLENQARSLNEGYFKRVATGLPFVTLKAAMSLDGKIATASGESRWITGERARAFGHRLRAHNDALVTGVQTVIADDPEFTVRSARGRTPLRIVVDSRARTPASSRLLSADQRPPVIAVTRHASPTRLSRLRKAGAELWVLPSRARRVDLSALMQRIVETGAQSVLLECGGTLAAGALAAGLVDRVYFFIAPLLIGGSRAPTPVEGAGVHKLADAWRLSAVRVRRVGEELLVIGDLVR